MSKLTLLIRSRKFWAAIVGVIFVVLTTFVPDFPLSQDQIAEVVYLIVAYILGTAIEDARKFAK